MAHSERTVFSRASWLAATALFVLLTVSACAPADTYNTFDLNTPDAQSVDALHLADAQQPADLTPPTTVDASQAMDAQPMVDAEPVADMSEAADMSQLALDMSQTILDMSQMVADMSRIPDMSQLPDLTPPVDLTPPPICPVGSFVGGNGVCTVCPAGQFTNQVNSAACQACPVCTPLDGCHSAGTCDQTTGLCSNPTATDGTVCDDGNACTQTDQCQAGTCTGADPVVCGTLDQCHVAGMCDPSTGACSNPNQMDGTLCNDGNPCTLSDTCQTGACIGAAMVMCMPSDQCHVAGTCDPTSGLCSNPPSTNGTPCNDGNSCTQTDTCQAGTCAGSNPVTCTVLDQCHVVGTCDPTSGLCSNPPSTNGTPCNDGNSCTQTDTCQAGTCAGSNPVICTALDQCHAVGTCNPTNGTCSNPNQTNGVMCNDGNACSQTDTCQGGQCVGEDYVSCSAIDQCHVAGNCDPNTGTCSTPTKTNGAGCNDGNPCTQTDNCQAGNCVGGNPVVCTALDQCHSAGTCDPTSGACSNPNQMDGTGCNDGNLCTLNDTCQVGTCTSGTQTVCSADACHLAGTCDPNSGICSVVPRTALPPVAAWYRGDGNELDAAEGWNGEARDTLGFAPGMVNQALVTTNGDLAIPGSLYFPTVMSFDAWIFCDGGNGAIQTIVGQNRAPGSSGYFVALDPDNVLGFYLDDGTNAYVIGTPSTLPYNQWVHIAAVRNGSTSSIYVNGALAVTGNGGFNTPLVDSGLPITLGSDNTVGRPFNGLIDEATLWSVALTGDQVAQIYQAGSYGKCDACLGVSCTSPDTCHFESCDTTAGVCEAPVTDATCGNTCPDLQSDDANCGACGTVCDAQATCVGGVCVCRTNGYTQCLGTCVNTQGDANNCGTCGNVCPVAKPQCISGVCN